MKVKEVKIKSNDKSLSEIENDIKVKQNKSASSNILR